MPVPRQDLRQYGPSPSSICVLHGGPGGAGEVEPFASELGRRGYPVLEPFQTKNSVGGQIEELKQQIERHASHPVTVIGWSWGAWLGCLLAAVHPALVRKLIVVGSGPLLPEYASSIRATKDKRLSEQEKTDLKNLDLWSGDPKQEERFFEFSDITDTFERDTSARPFVKFDQDIHTSVWKEANAMRESGALLKRIATIRCPVLAIHGDHDPHPAQGVAKPLNSVLPDARFELLERCGHKPWQEVHAKEAFYCLIEQEIL